MRSRVVYGLLVWLGVAALATAGGVPAIRSADALKAPIADDSVMFDAPPVQLDWQEKLSPLLWERIGDGGVQKVLILLHEPALLQVGGGGDLRSRALAAIEQRFVARTTPYGLRAIKGLSQLPIVIAEVPVAALPDIAADAAVRAIDPNIKLHAHRVQGGALIHAPDLRAIGGGGSGIGVAILDSGIDNTHTELQGQVAAGGDYTDAGGDGTNDDNGHGTACAGIVAGKNGGMAPQAHLWAMKVLDSEGSGDFAYTVEALNDVYEFRAQFGGAHVVSMSLGSSTQMFGGNCDSSMATMTSAMQQLVNAGITIFVSSGNDSCTTGVAFPSCVSHAISVGAVYDATLVGRTYGEGTCATGGCSDFSPVADQITCYSNSGDNLDILAPSHDCRTPKPGNTYDDDFGGTSAACPYAAGVAAQLLSKLGASGQSEAGAQAVTPAQLKTAMMNSGTPIADARNGVTRRRIDAMGAYSYLTGGGGGGGGGAGNTYWLPVVANAGGSGGSYFYSDIPILNVGSSSATISFTYYGPGSPTPATSSQPIPAGGQGIFRDIVGQINKQGTKGAIKIEANQPLKVTSRTYNKLSAGNSLGLAAGTTFGQYIEAYQVSEGLSSGQSAYLPGLTENPLYRTNIAVANFGSTSATATVALYNGSGSMLTSYSVSLAPGELKQENQPFLNKAGQSNLESGWAKVTVTSGSGVVSYASVLDNVATGGQKPSDPTTIPMKK